MVNLIRRFQKPMMILITILIIVSFIWLYNDSKFTNHGAADHVGNIYGRNVSQTQFVKEGRKYELARGLQLYGLVKVLSDINLPPGFPESMLGMYQLGDDAIENFIWGTFILREEAKSLNVDASQDEIEAAIKALAPFQTNGVYDSTKYNLFVQNALTPRGLMADALEDIVANDIRLKKLKRLIGTTTAPAPSEVREAFEDRFRKMETSVIRWNFDDFLKAQQITDEDVKKAYEERKSTIVTDEQRKVKFVSFVLPNSDKPLVGKERVDLLGTLSEKAQDFAVAMTAKDAKLDEVAAKSGAKVEVSPAFTPNEPPPVLGDSPEAAAAAFKLTKEQPHSDPIQTEKGYYIMELAEIIPARQKSLDEAKEKLTEDLKNERARETMNLKATEVRNKIEADLKAGKSFADAATAAGVKAETFPVFSPNEPPLKEADGREVSMTVADLQEGQLSQVAPTQKGSIIVRLDKFQPVDEAKFNEQKAAIATQVEKTKADALFSQWFKQRRAAANVMTVNRRS